MIKTNEERFLELYWKYQKLVLHVAVAKCGDYHYAQDICQETFIKMLRQMDLRADDEEIRLWLVTVANNAAIDSQKKGGRTRQMLEVDFASPEVERASVSANIYFDEIFRRDLRSRVLDGLRELDEVLYELVVLTCCIQLSITEAAERLNISYSEATRKLHRARSWVRSNFGEEYQQLKM